MAGGNAYEKLHVEAGQKGDFVNMLEHLNLPPKVVKFLKKNLRTIIIAILVIVVCSLAWAVYNVYKEKKINNSSSSLASALREPDATRQSALQKVVAQFPDTDSARWARAGLAHIDLKNGKFKNAAEQYEKIKAEIKPSNPLYYLVSYGLAQAQEAAGEYDESLKGYQALSETDGYRGIGLLGMARIYEIKGKPNQALSAYEQYMATQDGGNTNDPERAIVSEKIGRLKAKQ
jgi:predicted negative regulator of RcsB-dependent stress response